MIDPYPQRHKIIVVLSVERVIDFDPYQQRHEKLITFVNKCLEITVPDCHENIRALQVSQDNTVLGVSPNTNYKRSGFLLLCLSCRYKGVLQWTPHKS